MKSVFILGAGASKRGGAPLMDGFLDKAEELHRLRPSGFDAAVDAFDEVFALVSELDAVHAKSYMDLNNIEALFGAIDMGDLIGKLGDRRSGAIRRLRSSIVTLIVKTLEFSLNFPVSNKHISPPPPYRRFTRMLQKAERERSTRDPHRFAFITFNYDLALDFALFHQGIALDYCLEKGHAELDDGGPLPLLKLHGSLNWGSCPGCRQAIPLDFGQYRPPTHDDTKNVFYNFSSIFPRVTHCGDKPLRSTPTLVPPTWNKTRRHSQLRRVWHRAAVELSAAQNIFVIGYSLPETDSFFRYLYALGTLGSTRIRRLWVFNPAPGDETKKRFEAMVGRGIEHRFQYHRDTFTEALPKIEEALAAP